MPMNPLTPAKKQRLLFVLLLILIALFCSAAKEGEMVGVKCSTRSISFAVLPSAPR